MVSTPLGLRQFPLELNLPTMRQRAPSLITCPTTPLKLNPVSILRVPVEKLDRQLWKPDLTPLGLVSRALKAKWSAPQNRQLEVPRKKLLTIRSPPIPLQALSIVRRAGSR